MTNAKNNTIWLNCAVVAYILTVCNVFYNHFLWSAVAGVFSVTSILFMLFILSMLKNRFNTFCTYVVITYMVIFCIVLLPNPFNTINDATIYNTSQSLISIILNCIIIILVFFAKNISKRSVG